MKLETYDKVEAVEAIVNVTAKTVQLVSVHHLHEEVEA